MTKFYAHYDRVTSAILSVGGRPVPELFPDSEYAEIDADLAQQFMAHELDISQWFVGKSGDRTLVTKNLMELTPHDLGTMIELPRGSFNALGIRVTAILSDDAIEFTIPREYIGTKLETEDEKLTFTLTKRNDPTFVITEIEVELDKLLRGDTFTFEMELSLRDYSMFTNKRFHQYQFEVTAVPKNINQKVSKTRFDKTVVYRTGDTENGIKASVKKKELHLEIVGKTKLTWPSQDRCFVLLTKPNDPSVVYHALPFDVESFWHNKQVVLPLPKDIDQAFGIASFPLASDLVFNRKSDGNRKKTNNRV